MSKSYDRRLMYGLAMRFREHNATAEKFLEGAARMWPNEFRRLPQRELDAIVAMVWGEQAP